MEQQTSTKGRKLGSGSYRHTNLALRVHCMPLASRVPTYLNHIFKSNPPPPTHTSDNEDIEHDTPLWLIGGQVLVHGGKCKNTRSPCLDKPVLGPGGGGGWQKASVSYCLPLVAPIGLSPLLIPTLCGPERVLVVSTEPLDDLSCLTTLGSAVPETSCCPCR